MAENPLSVKFIQKETIHKGGIYKIMANANSIYSTGADGMVLKWSESLEHASLVCKTNVPNYTMDIRNNILCIGSANGFVTLIHIEEKKLIAQKKISDKSIFSIVILENRILIGSETGKIYETNFELTVTKIKPISDKSLRAMTPFNSKVLIGASDNLIYEIDHNLEITRVIQNHNNSVFTIKPFKEKQIISSGRDAKLVLTDLQSLETEMIDAHLNTINDISFAPNKEFFVTASRDKSFKIWSANSLKLLKVINTKKEKQLPPYSINSIVWCNDKIYTASDSGALICWQISNI